MAFKILGGGLAGCTLAALLPDSVIYERDKKLGGLCKQTPNYQEFIHILHCDNEEVWKFINAFTTVKPHSTLLKSYVRGSLLAWPPKRKSTQVLKKQIEGYSKKMWLRDTPKEAYDRIVTAEDGKIFHNTYEGVPDFTRLFKNLTRYTVIAKQDVRDGDLDGPIILTGAIDEYFNYCYGKLPYRGMKSVHYESEIGLDADYVAFSDEKIPFQRIVDYGRLGYEGQWLGIEIATGDAKHYPMLDDKSGEMYLRYKELADSKGILLAGRLATYHYIDMDQTIAQCIELARRLSAN